MVLSVIIVSYNVKYFLEQCLSSVQRAAGYDVEVFVIDNHSTDGTVEYLREKFPFAQFISNDENVGFAKANNQVLEKVRGKYVLFLNPDTLIPEDLFTNCISFLESKPDAGALGVRMIDGSGQFLKESKRGFPTPWVAFCKMSGLTKIFPTSKTFAKYYLGHLPEQQINVVDALAGACMFIRKDALNKTGGFDEQFFMYAEDIDLSYRMQQAGYKNYYFPDCTIIHFKGESTRKDKKYVRLFYNAMIQFSRKHFKGNFGNFLLEPAIRARFAVALTGLRSGMKKNIDANRRSILMVGEKRVIDKTSSNFAGVKKVEFLYETLQPSEVKHKISQNAYNEIICCESAGFSFKKIIALIDFLEAKTSIKITSEGSKSIVGSSSQYVQGDVIRL